MSSQAASGPLARLVRRVYVALNEHDAAAIGQLLQPDVEWDDPITGERLVGPDAIAERWCGSGDPLRLQLEPMRIREVDGKVVTDLRQNISDARGKAIATQMVRHVCAFRDARIATVEARDPD